MAAPALDPDVVAQLRLDLHIEDLRQVCRMMEQDAEAMLAVLAEAAARGDSEAWKHAAHRLAGGAGGVGATRLEAEARRAMAAGLEGAAIRLPLLVEAAQEACEALRGMRA